jgi:hypothetical protein
MEFGPDVNCQSNANTGFTLGYWLGDSSSNSPETNPVVSKEGNLTANSTQASSANSTAEPASGEMIWWGGKASSIQDPLPGHGKEFVAVILKPRSDNYVYSGVFTYIANRSAIIFCASMLIISSIYFTLPIMRPCCSMQGLQ